MAGVQDVGGEQQGWLEGLILLHHEGALSPGTPSLPLHGSVPKQRGLLITHIRLQRCIAQCQAYLAGLLPAGPQQEESAAEFGQRVLLCLRQQDWDMHGRSRQPLRAWELRPQLDGHGLSLRSLG